MFYCNGLFPNPILTVCEVCVLLQKTISKPHSDSIWSSCFTSADCVQTPFCQYVKFMFYFNRLYPNPILTVCEVHVLLQQIVFKPLSDSIWSSCFTSTDCIKPHSDSMLNSCFTSTDCIQTPFWQYVKFMFYFNRLYPNPILTVCEVHVLLQQTVSKPLSDSMWSSCFTSTDCIQTHSDSMWSSCCTSTDCIQTPYSDSMWSSCFTSTDCIQTPFWQYVKFMLYFNRLYPNPILTVCEVHVVLQQIVSKPYSDSMWSSCFTSTDCIQTPFWLYVKFMFYFNRLYPNPFLIVCEVHVLLQQIVSKPHSDWLWSSCCTSTDCIQTPFWQYMSSCLTSTDCIQTPFWRYMKFMFYFNRLYPNPILTVCEVHVLLQQIVFKPHSDCMWSSCFTSTDCLQTPFWLYVKFMFYFNRLYLNPILTVFEVHVLLQHIVSKPLSDCMWSSCFTSTDCIQTPIWLYVKFMFYFNRLYLNPNLTVC